MRGLSAREIKYDALVKNVRMSDYGYWVVTYSAEPGLDLSLMVCQTGITPDQAKHLAEATLTTSTGRKAAT